MPTPAEGASARSEDDAQHRRRDEAADVSTSQEGRLFLRCAQDAPYSAGRPNDLVHRYHQGALRSLLLVVWQWLIHGRTRRESARGVARYRPNEREDRCGQTVEQPGRNDGRDASTIP